MAELQGLLTALAAVDAMSDVQIRNDLVVYVRQELQVNNPQSRFDPERGNSRDADLRRIVHAVVNHPRALPVLAQVVALLAPAQEATDAFTQLCDRLAGREPVMLPDTTRRSLLAELDAVGPTSPITELFQAAVDPAPARDAPRTLRSAVSRLEQLAGPVPLFRFLEHLAACAGESDSAASLRRWIDTHLHLVPSNRHTELAELRRHLSHAGPVNDGSSMLQIHLERVDEKKFSVLAWLWPSTGPAGPNIGPQEVLPVEEIATWLGEVIDERVDGELSPDRRPRLEFVLPVEVLDEPVDQWEVPYRGSLHRLGADFRVVVRPEERSLAGTDLLTERWRTTSRTISTGAVAADVAAWLPAPGCVELPDDASLLCSDEWAWLAITCPIATYRVLLDAGAPVAVWLRGQHVPAARDRVLRLLAGGRQVDELPDAVCAFRRMGWQSTDIRRDLVLLWADPSRPPPERSRLAAPTPVPI